MRQNAANRLMLFCFFFLFADLSVKSACMADEIDPMTPLSADQSLFEDALQLTTPQARAAYLDSACRTDLALRKRIGALLRAHGKAGDFLEQPPTGLVPGGGSMLSNTGCIEQPGGRIGRYKLLEQIGEGGCGVVYMAEQEEPVRRRVALKVIKPGMDTKSAIARFEGERQALAMMNHANIAKVFDGGMTDAARPYFVMELVRGVPITEYCRDAQTDTNGRLRLFVMVCQAVQHAHQKGIIHRDLKPSNILVTVNDGTPVPKVIDFGIAKATDQRLTDKTLFTQFHSFIGTPAYISPEQAEMSSVDIDTRSDIYSLGVLLYELLTGKTPFDGETLLRSGIDEMRRVIRETEPPRPSTRLMILAAQSLPTASVRGIISEVRGDLDWIAMKCLEKDRARRYETASALAMDVQRHLDHEPILARPVNMIGKLWRWRRRRPAVAALSAGLLLLLMLVAVGATAAAWRISSARRTEHVERAKAEQAGTKLRHVNTQLADTINALELRHVEDLFGNNNAPEAVAHLTAMLRLDPSNHIAASRLVSALIHRNWALPAAPPMSHLLSKVTSVSFSPDGRHVLSAGWDGTAHIWDGATSRSMIKVHHTSKVTAAQYNNTGDRFVTASEDGTARVWKTANGEPVTPPLFHSAGVLGAEFSPDGQRIVTFSNDKFSLLWNAATGALQHELRGHTNAVTVAHFSPDGHTLATGGAAGEIQLWQVDSGEQIHVFDHGVNSSITALAFSPDGGRLVSASADHTAQLWHTATGTKTGYHLQHDDVVNHAVFSPNGALVLTTSGDYSARLWDATTGAPIRQPLMHAGGVLFGAFSPDGEVLATSGMDNSTRLWKVATGTLLCQRLQQYEAVGHTDFSPDGQRLVAASFNGIVQVWNIQPRDYHGIAVDNKYMEPHRTALAFDPQGKSVLTGLFEKTTQLWNSRTGEALGEPIHHAGAVRCVDYSPDGSLFVSAADDGMAWLCDATNGKIAGSPLQHSRPVTFAQFSPDNSRVVTTCEDGTARVWDAATHQPVAPPMEHGASVLMAKFSPDGFCIVTASANRSARVWDAKTSLPVTDRLQHLDSVRWAEFSPDSQRVVTASNDNSARLWDAHTGRRIAPALQHERTVEKATFSPDGRLVATASLDLTARIWDAHTGEALTPPLLHNRSVSQVCFSPDGQRVLTSGWATTSRLWDAATGRPLTEWLGIGGPGFTICFDSTGQRLFGNSINHLAKVWDAPPIPTPVPTWFLDFAEAVGGICLSAHGNKELISRQKFEVAAQQLADAPGDGFYERMSRWFLADPLHRPVSPF